MSDFLAYWQWFAMPLGFFLIGRWSCYRGVRTDGAVLVETKGGFFIRYEKAEGLTVESDGACRVVGGSKLHTIAYHPPGEVVRWCVVMADTDDTDEVLASVKGLFVRSRINSEHEQLFGVDVSGSDGD